MPTASAATSMGFELWPFQKQVVQDARQAIREHKSIGIILPTGGGKTAVSGDISLRVHRSLAHKRQGPVALYLVHRTELLDQTADTLDKIGLGDEYGFIAPGRAGHPWRPLQIASISYLRIESNLNEVKKFLDPKIIFVDEGHHIAAETWKAIVRTFPNAYIVVLTATPARLDGKPLGEMIDYLVLGPQIRELTPDYLAPVRTFSIAPSFDQARASLKAQSAGMTKAIIADSLKNWQKFGRDRPTIFFAVDVKHSNEIVESLRAQCISAVHIDYKTPDITRKRIMRDLRGGHIQCVSNVNLFTEGTDWPDCSCVVLARNTTSFTLYRQMNGRCMRRKPKGQESLILDLAGNVHMHGLPDEDVHWELEYGVSKEERKRIANKSRQCDSCSFVYDKKELCCPRCGAKPESGRVIELDHELSEAQEVIRSAPRAKRRELMREVFATGGNEQKLEEIRARYGYSAAWKYKMIQLVNANKGPRFF